MTLISIEKNVTHLSTVEKPNPRGAFLELGILPLELWHERILEDHIALERAPAACCECLGWALNLKWLDGVSNPPMELSARQDPLAPGA